MSLLLVLLVITGFVFLVLAAFSVAQIGRFQWLPGGQIGRAHV